MSEHLDRLRAALVGRYIIGDEVGSGGMATVYLAEDLKHGRDVALKVLNPELTSLLGSQRFLREIEIAAKLNHPHILTLIDSGDAQGLLYYVMPFVQQESLRDHLVREGQLPVGEAIRITQQVASALEFAHRHGVIHRDVKPENVLLHEGVAVVADFGIALALNEATGGRITGIGMSLGTPEYMSPEQTMGHETDARSDVYSLGCVLYEMLVGEPPFIGPNAQAIFTQRLTDRVPSARDRRPEVSADLEEALSKALSRDRSDRFQSMAEFAEVVTASSTSGAAAIPAAPAGGPRSRRVIWSIAVVILLVAGATFFGRSPSETVDDERIIDLAALTRGVEPRPSIAVLGFKNLSGREDVAWLSTALAEMLTTELASGQALRTIPGEVVSRMKVELSLPEAESFGDETLAAIQRNLGTEMVVVGSFVALGGLDDLQIRVDVRLQNTVAGETVVSLAESGTATDLFALVARAGTRLRDELGIGGMSITDERPALARRPANTDAARLYAEGLEQSRRFNASEARELLERSVARDPDYAPAHSALSRVWSQLGYDQRAMTEAELAYQLSGDLPEQERLLVEARYRETQREWDRAIEIYRSLWTSQPDNVELGLALASAQRIAGSRQDAMATVEALKQLPVPLSDDARIDLAECHIAELIAEYQRQQQACAEARIKATAQGAVLLVARSWFLEGRSWFFLNDTDKSLAAFDEAKRVYDRTGHRSEVANVLNGSSIVRRTRGDRAGALRDAEEALAIKRETGEQAGIAMVLNSLGIVVQQQGDLDRAAKLYEEAVALNRETGNLPNVPAGMINLANVHSRLGDLERSSELYREAGAIAEQTDNTYTQALALNNLRAIEYDRGDLAEARRIGQTAHEIFSEIDHQLMLGYTTFGLGEILQAEGDLEGARMWFDSSLAIRDALELQTAQDTRRALAILMLEDGDYAEAETWIRETQVQYDEQLADADEGVLAALLAQALAGQSKLAEAREAADRATSLLAEDANRKIRIRVSILVAEINADAASFREEKRKLQSVLEEAEEAGYAVFAFEARLALGRMERRYGDAAAGRAALNALERDASGRGFRLIARKAADAAAME